MGMANSVKPDQIVPSGLLPFNRPSCAKNRVTIVIQCTCNLILSLLHIIIIIFLINVQGQGHHPHQWAPFQITG